MTLGRTAAYLIRRRQPPQREFYLTVGKLAPVFDDCYVATSRIFVENLTRLKTRGVQRQRKDFAQKANILQSVQAARIARPIRQILWALHR
jgi:hypothetical protein